MSFEAPSDRTRVRRLAARGSYDPAQVREILDEALIAHVGITADHGPVVLPMTYARMGDTLYLHGAAGNALLAAADGKPVCVEVTLLDGLVLARSMFHHSMNFRSVVIFGTGRRTRDAEECMAASIALADKMWPGRGAEARAPYDSEVRATAFLAVDITEASVKTRAGGPVDDEEDMGVDVWAGVVPIVRSFGTPIADDQNIGRLPARA